MLNKIDRLKSKARKYYKEYNRILDSMGCGITLTSHISSELNNVKNKFNSVLDKLSKLDPNCTVKRL